jgi:hypothetical protein
LINEKTLNHYNIKKESILNLDYKILVIPIQVKLLSGETIHLIVDYDEKIEFLKELI